MRFFISQVWYHFPRVSVNHISLDKCRLVWRDQCKSHDIARLIFGGCFLKQLGSLLITLLTTAEVRVHVNVVPRSTMNTNGGTELTLKCKLKCYVKHMKDPLGLLALVQEIREPHEVKKKIF